MTAEYDAHMETARARLRGFAVDMARLSEDLVGWAVAAQADKSVLEAAYEARGALRKIRNLLHPESEFPDEVPRLRRAQ